MDERYDIIRTVRDGRFRYIRNYEPLKTFYQYMNTPEKGATMRELRRLHEAGELPAEAEYYFSKRKPVEELYDCDADPHEINNLAADPAHADVLKRMRRAHLDWVQETRDLGLIPEPIIAERREAVGTEYEILRQPGSDKLAAQIGAIAAAASEGIESLPQLLKGTEADDSTVRYWAATGIGNIGAPAKAKAAKLMKAALGDESSAVRTAAAPGALPVRHAGRRAAGLDPGADPRHAMGTAARGHRAGRDRRAGPARHRRDASGAEVSEGIQLAGQVPRTGNQPGAE